MPSYHLTYFHGRGLGEVSRLIFAATNTAFTETRLPIAFNPGAAPTWPEFEALRATGALPYGQVPTLELDGAPALGQSKYGDEINHPIVTASLSLPGTTMPPKSHRCRQGHRALHRARARPRGSLVAAGGAP